ncbi:MAG: pilin [Candidatus Uhrbacteria bacterium]
MNVRIKQLVGLAATAAIASVAFLPMVTFAATPVGGAGASGGPDLGLNQIGGAGGISLGGGDVRTTAARIINVALGFLGIIAVVIVLIGGFKYMVSGGNEEKTSEAKNMIVAGIIGLAIILSAWAITTFVVSSLLTATTETV